MADERIKYLFDRYLAGIITTAEKQELSVLGLMTGNKAMMDSLFEANWEQTKINEVMPEEKAAIILSGILGKATGQEKERIVVSHLHWKKIAVAASILLVIGLGSYFLFFNKSSKPVETAKVVEIKDVDAPKVSKATITLADGRTVSVDSLSILTQSNVQLLKTTDGKIVYSGNAEEIVYNTLTNPRGSKVIDMILSDGSHVWLNAGSSVTYPVAFTGNERKVIITGEAYFEVNSQWSIVNGEKKKIPFIVDANGVTTEVLGTHFNVNAYNDEESIKVTLLEGSVIVNQESSIPDKSGQAVKLKPGEQVIATDNAQLAINKNVDVEQVMAWKNGLFSFNRAGIKEVLRQLSRWYDVEVSFEGNVPSILFGGEIQRTVPLSKVLENLEKYGVKLEIEGKKIIVRK